MLLCSFGQGWRISADPHYREVLLAGAESLASRFTPHVGGIKSWDLCGPEAVLVAAGGRVTTLEGTPIDYAGEGIVHTRGFVGTNGALHDAVLAEIRTLAS